MSHITLRNVHVDFPVYTATARSLKSALLSSMVGRRINRGRGNRPIVSALRGIDLEIDHGDRVALVGRNGAGKSTLLRVLAGVYEPPVGELAIQGRVSSLTDVSMGMDLDASGYENIILRGTFLGMCRADMQARTAEIERFTELGEYLHLPLRTYSSGMQLRLGFAVTTCVEPDILIMDELIGVGDAAFMEKANERITSLIDRASIMVLASHDDSILRRFCNRAILLHDGKIALIGGVDDVITEYRKFIIQEGT